MKYTVLAFLLTAIFSAHAQGNFKFGKVSKEEVAQQQHPLEADAEAAILYKKERVYYDYDANDGFKTIRDVHMRVKVYTKSGLDWGNFKVSLYTSNNGEEIISSVKGLTYNLINDKLVETKLKKDGIFKENVNKYRNRASIAMPEVREGSVVELSYKVTSDLAGNLDEFKFQYGIPVNKVDVSVEIPQYFVFKRYGKGFYPIDIQQSRKNRKLSVTYRDNSSSKVTFSNPTQQPKNKTSTLEFFENVYKVNVDNIPSLKEEDYTDNIDNYRSAIKFELASTQFPNTPYKNYSLSWEDVAESIYGFDSFGGELKKTRLVEDVVKELRANSGDTSQLLYNIYEYVKNTIAWNDYNGVLCENGIKKTLQEKVGNVADINLLLTTMLREAGFEANPILVSTKSHGIPLFPTREGFNYVLASAQVGQETVLMDATEKMGTVGILSSRALNWQGRLIKKGGTSTTIDLTPKTHSKETTFAAVTLNPDGSLSGKLRTQLTENNAFMFRNSHKDEPLDEIMDDLEARYVGMEVNGLEIKNKEECLKPIIEVYEFNKEGQIEVISGKLYFKPTLFLGLSENPFKSEKREYPIDFLFPQAENITINITLPEGYMIESLPENSVLGLPDNLGNFKYVLRQQANMLQVSCATQLNIDLMPATYYESVKEFYNQMVNKLNEQVVLVKG